MTKNQATYIFRGVGKLADALGITRQAIYKWPNVLTDKQENQVIGAAMRLDLDLKIPESVE